MRAKKEGFAARSIYKLEELDQRFRLTAPGARVLDLGAAPGSWMQYLSRAVGANGRLLGIDLQEVRVALPAHARALVADVDTITPEDLLREARVEQFDAVVSDMAPRTTGITWGDAVRSARLAMRALELARATLRTGGSFACKVFQGEDFEGVLREARASFSDVKVLRPDATRKRSPECFIVARGFKKPAAP